MGALLSLFLPIVPSLFSTVLLLFCALLCFSWSKTRFLSFFCLGMSWMFYSASSYQSVQDNQQHWLHQLASQTIVIEGSVTGIAQIKESSQRFNFTIEKLAGKPLSEPIKVRLSWQQADRQTKQKIPVKDQQSWQLTVRIKPAYGLANSGGFSYQTWLRRHNIHATGYVLNSGDNLVLNQKSSLRQALYDQTLALLPAHDLSALVIALSFGERGQLTKKHWQVLTLTATQHLIAISGLHLGLVAAASYFVIDLILMLLPFTLMAKQGSQPNWLKVNNKLVAIIFSCVITSYYAYLAGFSVPTMRALLMLLLFWFAKLSGIKLSLTRWLAITVFIVTLCFPDSLFSASFWLSFYAVTIIFLLLWRFTWRDPQDQQSKTRADKWLTWLKGLITFQCSLIVLMLPITVMINYQLSWLALPANLVAVPWMSVTSIPLSLLAVLVLPLSQTLAVFIFNISQLTIEWLWHWFEWLAQLPMTVFPMSLNSYILLLIAIIWLFVTVFIVNRLRFHIIFFMIFGIASFVLTKVYFNSSEDWRVYVMDVGQGLSVIVEADHQVLLYDTGARFPSGFSMAEAVLLPFLKQRGYQAIDVAFISHDDNDHSGGLALLQQQLTINQLVYNESKNAMPCLQGQVIKWQFLTIEMLWPQQKLAQHNDDSCVIKISDNSQSILLTGDISSQTERLLVKDQAISLKSDVLVVPHHGSKSSSSVSFIQAVSPQLAIFSAGYLNRWRMPVTDVVQRYENNDIATLNSAQQGMIQIDMVDNKLKVSTFRQQLWPFWFAN
nr:DNA internalization-related competence protein ComEC/Rec2 [Thalassotalea sp. G2M2-11]